MKIGDRVRIASDDAFNGDTGVIRRVLVMDTYAVEIDDGPRKGHYVPCSEAELTVIEKEKEVGK